MRRFSFFQLVILLAIIKSAFANPDTVLVKVCFKPGTSNFTGRTFQIYDSVNSVNMNYLETWNNQSLSWEPDWRYYYYYNPAGDTVFELWQSWATGWINQVQIYRIFDTNHRIQSLYYFNGGTTDTTYGIQMAYDTAGVRISDTTYKYNNGIAELYRRSDYNHSSSGKLNSKIVFSYDSLHWDSMEYWNYFRDVTGRDSVTFKNIYNYLTGTNDSSFKISYTHDSVIFVDTIISYEYLYIQQFGGVWSWLNSDILNYDSLGRIIHHYYSCSSCGHGTKTYKYLGTNDSLEYDVSCYFNHGSGNPGCYDSCVYPYPHIITGKIEIETWNPVIYPVPATNYLNIISGFSNGEMLTEIFNVFGDLVYTRTSYADRTSISIIDLSGFATGTYFIRLKKTDNIISKKFIIIR